MALDDTRRFVLKMRANLGFRERGLKTANPGALDTLFRQEGFRMDREDIVEAMGDYLQQIER